ncbi:hypothetical protein EMIHUDRAFT_118916 [Emiliania huxleyi CCMP1516]|uniref:Uncharacterized protein n=2 Tax=Emiliania huxleyi TaxID=2903 RepID=A0A0D3IZE3_EMIH1|nr:hypothetical protein EMIHUDRAFT_118916 [Emiliania huxleyi CCMP1516]EOD16628.1 hypothetical protein EMIHUDRAFT_118916 [Emiliania huxleyi CCMP1516]|eukprot:XP_005769057.1 hypothetical protein EMIHUDRAFT_118916 [Emiliania huxleyi CCMP1516]
MEEAARRVRCCIMFFLLALAGAHAAAKGQFPEWRFQGRDVVVKIPRDSGVLASNGSKTQKYTYDLDDAVIHFRCGDIMEMDASRGPLNSGFVPLSVLLRYLRPLAPRSVGIVTTPLVEKCSSKLETRAMDCKHGKQCHDILEVLLPALQSGLTGPRKMHGPRAWEPCLAMRDRSGGGSMVVSGAWREADLANGSHPPATALDAARTRSLFRLIHLPKTGGTSVETLLSLGHQPHRRLSKLAWWCGALDASPSIRAAGCSSGVGRSSSPFLLPHGVGMRQLARRLRLAEAFLADNADVVGTTDQLDDVIVTLCHLAGASAAGVAAAAAAASASPAAAANGTAWARRLARGNVLPRCAHASPRSQ